MILARALGFALVHFAPTVMLARIERAIIEEVISRRLHAGAGLPSPAQWIPRFLTRWRIQRATLHLHQTLARWRWEGAHREPCPVECAPPAPTRPARTTSGKARKSGTSDNTAAEDDAPSHGPR